MKIKFTSFNNGQEHFEFDTPLLQEGEYLDKFLLNKDDDGKIYIVPMVSKGCSQYPLEVLDKIV